MGVENLRSAEIPRRIPLIDKLVIQNDLCDSLVSIQLPISPERMPDYNLECTLQESTVYARTNYVSRSEVG